MKLISHVDIQHVFIYNCFVFILMCVRAYIYLLLYLKNNSVNEIVLLLKAGIILSTLFCDGLTAFACDGINS